LRVLLVVTLDKLEDWQQQNVISAAPHSFGTDDEERLKIVITEDFLFDDELSARETLRTNEKEDSKKC